MYILNTVAGFDAGGGGVSTCLRDLISAMQSSGNRIELLTTQSNKPMLTVEDWVRSVPCDYRTPLALSRNFKHALNDSNADVYHTHGLWMHCNHLTCAIARQKGKPYVITPHGMLYGEALRRSSWKKWPVKKLWFDKDIRQADAIHVTCAEEAEQVRAYGYRGRIEIIPNPMVIPDYINEVVENRIEPDVTTIGFLGRLHPVKGIEYLIDAFAIAIKQCEARLEIMGSGDDGYVSTLKDRVHKHGIFDYVDFVGHVAGRDKFQRLSQISVLFVPSDFENFGMIVPESLIVETPVMASTFTPWQSLNEHDAGWWIDRDANTMAQLIIDISKMSSGQLRAMGRRGAEMVRERFDSNVVAKTMIDLYHSL